MTGKWNGKRAIVIIAAVVAIGIMVCAWPLNLFWGDSLTDEVDQSASYKEYTLSADDYVEQRFTAADKRLGSVSLYLTNVGYVDAGTIEVAVRDADGNALVREERELTVLSSNAFNEVKLGCDLETGKQYMLQVSLHADKNIGINAVESKEEAASGSQEFYYDGTQKNGYLAVSYQYRSDFNKVQTLMTWMICVIVFAAVIWVSVFFGWEEFDRLIFQIKTGWQIFVAMFAISVFNFAAFSSNAVKIKKTFSVMWTTYLFWILTLLVFVYLIKKSGTKKIRQIQVKVWLQEHKAAIVMLAAVIISRVPMIGTLQKWDAGEYYQNLIRACENYDFSIQGFIQNFRLCTHSNLGYSFVMAIGEFLDPKGGIGVQILTLILTGIAAYCLYELFGRYWLNCKNSMAALLTFIVFCTPVFLGTFSYINVDYMLALFLIFVMYTEYRGWNILLAVCAVILSQTKETGVVIVAGYFGFKILYCFICTHGNIALRVKACFSKSVTWVAVAAGTVYALMIIRLGSLSGWVQSADATTTMTWSSSGINCFGFQPHYMGYKLAQLFLMNFAWILTMAGIVAGVVLFIEKKREKRKMFEKLIGLIGGLFAFLLFGLVYVTYTLERYNIFFAVGYTILVLCLVYCAFSEKKRKRSGVCVAVAGAVLMFVQAFWSVDVLSEKVFGTVEIGNGNQMLFSSLGFRYYGDGLVCNYQYSWLDKAFDKMLRQVNYNQSTEVLTTRKQSVATLLDGSGKAYQLNWDTAKGERTFKQSDDTISISAVSMETVFSMLPFRCDGTKIDSRLKQQAVLYFIPYYEENENENLDIVSKYYYLGAKDEVSAYGGTIQYYNMIKKDNVAGVSLGDLFLALNQDEEDVTFTAKSCDELVADAVEQTGWSQTAVNRKVAYDAIEEGENVLLLDPARTTVEENDVINMKVTAYDAEENKLGESYIGNVTGNKYENVVVQDGKLLDGIKDALIGCEVGNTVTVTCKIPEDYLMAGDYAGQDITFELQPTAIVEKWQPKEKTETEESMDYVNDEWAVWQTVQSDVQKQVLLETVRSGVQEASAERDAYIIDTKERYKDYLNTCGISKEYFASNYLDCSEDEYEMLIEAAADARMRKDFVDDSLKRYKKSWDYVSELYVVATGEKEAMQDETADQQKLEYARTLFLGERTKSEVYHEIDALYGGALEKLTDKEFIEDLYMAMYSKSAGTEEINHYLTILAGGSREDVILAMEANEEVEE